MPPEPLGRASVRALTTTLPTVGVLVRLVPDDGCGPAEGQVPFGSHGGGG